MHKSVKKRPQIFPESAFILPASKRRKGSAAVIARRASSILPAEGGLPHEIQPTTNNQPKSALGIGSDLTFLPTSWPQSNYGAGVRKKMKISFLQYWKEVSWF